MGERSAGIVMKITTAQLKSLMAADDAVVAPHTLCRVSKVKYDPIRMRLTYKGKGGGKLKPEEEEALGDGLASFLKEHLGWRVEEG